MKDRLNVCRAGCECPSQSSPPSSCLLVSSSRLCLNGKLVSQTTDAGKWPKNSSADGFSQFHSLTCRLCHRQAVSCRPDPPELLGGGRRPPAREGRGLRAHLWILPAQPHLLGPRALRGRMCLPPGVSDAHRHLSVNHSVSQSFCQSSCQERSEDRHIYT